jgi:hypothetical protein
MGQLRIEVAVMIPGGVDDVHHPHPSLDHPPGQQAIAREGAE